MKKIIKISNNKKKKSNKINKIKINTLMMNNKII